MHGRHLLGTLLDTALIDANGAYPEIVGAVPREPLQPLRFRK